MKKNESNDEKFNPFHFNQSRLNNSYDTTDNGLSKVVIDDESYKILVNVKNFNPEDLVIKTVDDCVVVEANHEDKTVDGKNYSSQCFSQSFNLPHGINPESVTSALSKDGILTISAPLNQAMKNIGYSNL